MFAFAIPFEKLRWYLPGADPRCCLFNGFAVDGHLGWKALAMLFSGELTKFGVTTARFCQEEMSIWSPPNSLAGAALRTPPIGILAGSQTSEVRLQKYNLCWRW
jgi:hypothetical protein